MSSQMTRNIIVLFRVIFYLTSDNNDDILRIVNFSQVYTCVQPKGVSMGDTDDYARISELIERCKPLQQELRKILDDLMEENKRKIGGLK